MVKAKGIATDCIWLAILLFFTSLPTNLIVQNHQVTFFWPASGIAVAMLLQRGYRSLLPIFILNAAQILFHETNARLEVVVFGGLGLTVEASATAGDVTVTGITRDDAATHVIRASATAGDVTITGR